MPEITIPGPDGGFGAYLALPAATPAGGIVVSQEIFGGNAVMRGVCDWLKDGEVVEMNGKTGRVRKVPG